jgi:heterodisulfide reductase subunit C
MECCGNLLLRAGSEETASAMCRSKLTDVTNAGAEAIVVVCPSCMMQYDNVQYGLQREGESLHVPVFYYPQLLGLALGLAPEEVGLDRHRVTVTPFLQRWEERRESFDHIREHWDLRLLQACADCGACVDDCPVARNNTSYNPNELIRALAQGKLDEVLTSPVLWQCVECYTCAEMCPNKYDQMTILRKAKTLALRAGQAPQSALEGIRAFQQSGQLTQASVAQRKRLGLPAPPTAAIAELQTLLQQGEETQSHV